MDPLLNFEQQSAIITGAASGFGKLLAIELASRGCNLVLGDIDTAGLEQTLEALPLKQNRAVVQRCDVSDEAQCQAMAETAMREFGRLDIAVNNAGIAHSLSPLHQLEQAVMDKQMAVNVNGVLFGMKAQIAAMLPAGKGRILNVSSLAGIGGAPKAGAYVAAKHAVVGLTRSAAVEYARKGILVNAICPYYSPTNILATDNFDAPENLARLAQGSPMKRLPEPQEVVNTMLLILSPGNSFMTGQTIAIDGGVTAW